MGLAGAAGSVDSGRTAGQPGEPKAGVPRRRALLGAGLAAFGAATVAAAGPAAAGSGGVLDLTHPLGPDLPVWPGNPPFVSVPVATYERGGFAQNAIASWEHIGTHVDAPLHRDPRGIGVDLIAPEDLVAPLVVLDIRARVGADPDAAVTVADIDAWRAAHGEIPERAFVAALTGWESRLAEPAAFLNLDATGTQRTPGWTPEAAAHLITECGAVGFGIDTLSLDRGAARDSPAHTAILGSGRYGVEMLADLAAAPAAGATVVVGAPKHTGGTGGPARVLALT
ncbi:cyclase family protein [Nocardia harenae]|uniref:cyclase family protein n=1 Tax=Nocardia harenae TaxID=358707 RepID=UPI001FE21FC7|nr:cyclase family protein [Nocardia harenae]